MAGNSKEIKDIPESAQSKGGPQDIQQSKPPVSSPSKGLTKGRGRPPGAKNKDTLFKELMTGKFQDIAAENVQKTLEVLFAKAHEGDMKAIKLVLDRVVPVTKAVDLADMEKKGLVVNISVGTMGKPDDDLVDVEYVEIDDAD